MKMAEGQVSETAQALINASHKIAKPMPIIRCRNLLIFKQLYNIVNWILLHACALFDQFEGDFAHNLSQDVINIVIIYR